MMLLGGTYARQSVQQKGWGVCMSSVRRVRALPSRGPAEQQWRRTALRKQCAPSKAYFSSSCCTGSENMPQQQHVDAVLAARLSVVPQPPLPNVAARWLARLLALAALAMSAIMGMVVPRIYSVCGPIFLGSSLPAASTAIAQARQHLHRQAGTYHFTHEGIRNDSKTSTMSSQYLPAAPASDIARPNRASTSPLPASATMAALSHYREQSAQQLIASKIALLVQLVLNANVAVKIFAVFAAAVPIVWLGGLAYSLITGAPIELGWFKIYSVVIRAPGAKVTEETSLPAAVLINMFFLCGLFTFAVLIGIVSEEIKNSLKSVRTGNYPVVCGEHTLILNWNEQALLLLRKIVADGHGCSRTLGRKIVVLVPPDVPKEKLEAELSRMTNGSGVHVMLREGQSHFVRDLEAVSAASARTVILLHRDSDEESEVHKVATLLGLQTARSHPSTAFASQRIVLQNPEAMGFVPGYNAGEDCMHADTPLGIIKDSMKGRDMKLVEVNGSRNITRLIAQSAVQPGVATIHSSIAQSIPGAPDLYVRECGEDLAGSTYGEARRRFDHAVICGYIESSSRLTHLNPPDSRRLEYADRLIGLAHSREEFSPTPPSASTTPQPDMQADKIGSLQELAKMLETAAPITHRPKSIVVIGWADDVADLVTAVLDFGYAGSEITVVSDKRPAHLPETGAVAVHWVEGGVLDRAAYERAGVASAHSVILGRVHSADPKAADARMLTSLLLVQDIVSDSRHAPHIVATMQKPETVLTAHHILSELGKGRLTAELLQPDEMVSGMLLQVANEPALAPTLSELTTDSLGSEIYLRRPEPYGLAGPRSYTFREVSELARLRGETALGWLASVKGGEGDLVLAPPMAQDLRFTPDSRIIVLAEDWEPHKQQPTTTGQQLQPVATRLAAGAAMEVK